MQGPFRQASLERNHPMRTGPTRRTEDGAQFSKSMITAKKFNFFFQRRTIYILPFSFKSRKTNLKANPHKNTTLWRVSHPNSSQEICSPGGQQITQSFSIIHCQHLPSSNILKNFTLIEMKYCAFDPSDYREPLNSSFKLARGGYNYLIMRILPGPASS